MWGAITQAVAGITGSEFPGSHQGWGPREGLSSCTKSVSSQTRQVI